MPRPSSFRPRGGAFATYAPRRPDTRQQFQETLADAAERQASRQQTEDRERDDIDRQLDSEQRQMERMAVAQQRARESAEKKAATETAKVQKAEAKQADRVNRAEEDTTVDVAKAGVDAAKAAMADVEKRKSLIKRNFIAAAKKTTAELKKAEENYGDVESAKIAHADAMAKVASLPDDLDWEVGKSENDAKIRAEEARIKSAERAIDLQRDTGVTNRPKPLQTGPQPVSPAVDKDTSNEIVRDQHGMRKNLPPAPRTLADVRRGEEGGAASAAPVAPAQDIVTPDTTGDIRTNFTHIKPPKPDAPQAEWDAYLQGKEYDPVQDFQTRAADFQAKAEAHNARIQAINAPADKLRADLEAQIGQPAILPQPDGTNILNPAIPPEDRQKLNAAIIEANRQSAELADAQNALGQEEATLQNEEKQLQALQQQEYAAMDAATDKLGEQPGMKPFTDRVKAMDADFRKIVAKIPDEAGRQKAFEDYQARRQAAMQEGAANREQITKAAADLWNARKTQQGTIPGRLDVVGQNWLKEQEAAFGERLGLTPKQTEAVITDYGKLNDEWEDGLSGAEQSRALSDGRVIVNPTLWVDSNAYEKAVKASEGSEEGKKQALENLPRLKAEAVTRLLNAVAKSPELAQMINELPGKTDEERVDALLKSRRDHPMLRATAARLKGGADALAGSVMGLISLVTGNEWATESMMAWNEEAGANEALAGASGLSDGTKWGAFKNFMTKVPAGAQSVIPALAGGGGAGLAARVLGAGQKTAQAAQIAGSAVAAGLQSTGGTYGEAFDSFLQGRDYDAARSQAIKPALISGLITAAATYAGGARGVESIFREPAGRAVAKQALKDALRAGGISILKEGSEEFLEEALDQLGQAVLAKYTYQPDKPLSSIITEVLEAGALGAVLGGGMGAAKAYDDYRTQDGKDIAKAADLAASDEELRTVGEVNPLAATRAMILRDIAQGTDITTLQNDQLAAVGLQRTQKGEIKPATGKDALPPAIAVENGKPIILQPALDELEQQFPATRALVGMSEQEARAKATAPPKSVAHGTSSSVEQSDANVQIREAGVSGVSGQPTSGATAVSKVPLGSDSGAPTQPGGNAQGQGSGDNQVSGQEGGNQGSAVPVRKPGSGGPSSGLQQTGVGGVDVQALPQPASQGAGGVSNEGPVRAWTARTDKGTILTVPAGSAKTAAEAELALAAQVPTGEVIDPASIAAPEAAPAKPTGAKSTTVRDQIMAAAKPIVTGEKDTKKAGGLATRAKMLAEAVEREAGKFNGIVFEPVPDSSGFSIRSDGSLAVDVELALRHLEGKSMADVRRFITRVIKEEFQHRISIELERDNKDFGDKLQAWYDSLPDDIKQQAAATYNAQNGGKTFRNDFEARHETFRQFLERKNLTEAALAPKARKDLRELILAFVKALRAYYRTAAPQVRALLDELIQQAEAKAAELQGLDAKDASIIPPTQTGQGKTEPKAPDKPQGVKAVEDMTPDERRADEKRIQRKLMEVSLETEDKDEPFRAAGYTKIGGIWVHPHVDPDFVRALKPATMKRLREGNITFIDPETESSGRAVLMSDGTRGIALKTDRKIGQSLYTLKDEAALHELGHHVWRDDLTQEQRDAFKAGGIRTEHGREVASGKGRGAGYASSIAGGVNSVAEEDFAQHFAENAGDTQKAIAPAPTVDAAANEADTDATDAQKEAENHKVGRVTLLGHEISIETPAGAKRRPEWPALKDHYGRILGTTGADSTPEKHQHLDAFVREGTPADWTGPVFVVNQNKPDGSFDEHKTVWGAKDSSQAKATYLRNYAKGWRGLGSVVEMTPDQFRTWTEKGDMSKPAPNPANPRANATADKLEALAAKTSDPKLAEGYRRKAAALRAGQGQDLATKDAPAPAAPEPSGKPEPWPRVMSDAMLDRLQATGNLPDGYVSIPNPKQVGTKDQWLVGPPDDPVIRAYRIKHGLEEKPEPQAAPPSGESSAPKPVTNEEAQATFIKLRRGLRKAMGAKNWPEVLKQVAAYRAHYDRPGAEPEPDSWSEWERAEEDAKRNLGQTPDLVKPITKPLVTKPGAAPQQAPLDAKRVKELRDKLAQARRWAEKDVGAGIAQAIDDYERGTWTLQDTPPPDETDKALDAMIAKERGAWRVRNMEALGKQRTAMVRKIMDDPHAVAVITNPQNQDFAIRQNLKAKVASILVDELHAKKGDADLSEFAKLYDYFIEHSKNDAWLDSVIKEIRKEAAPTPAPKPAPPKAPATKVSAEEAATDDKLRDALSDLFSPSTGLSSPAVPDQRGIPRDKSAKFFEIAGELIDQGVKTPRALADRLERIFQGKARPFSQAIWNFIGTVDPSLSGQHDWNALYNEQSEKPAEPAPVDKKQAEEAVELQVVKDAREIVARGESPGETFDALVKLYEDMPALTAKTSTSKINQAYSTPPPIAYVGSRLADIVNGTVVAEYTAGNGMLLMESKPTQIVLANELDPKRRARLESLDAGFIVSDKDATTWLPPQKPDRVYINPPFGTVMGENGLPKLFDTPFGKTTSIDHAIVLQSLATMNIDGRAVFIIGGPPPLAKTDNARAKSYSGGSRGEFFRHLYENWKVSGHFTINGDLYAKQGAGWPIDVIVVDGAGKSPMGLPTGKPPPMLNTWAELKSELSKSDEDRIAASRFSEAELITKVDELGDALGGLSRPSGGTVTSNRPDAPPRTPATGSGTGTQQPGMDQGPGSTGGVSPPSVRPPSVEGLPEHGGTVADGATVSPANSVLNADESGNTLQVPYQPASGVNPGGFLAPLNLSGPMMDALGRLKERVGDLVPFVHKKLKYGKDEDITQYFFGDQIDAIALAIDNFENGGALVVGDMTGTGKGRIAAALMRYAVNEGKTPIFVTKNQELYMAMLGDLADINSSHIVPIITDNNIASEIAKTNDKITSGKKVFEEVAKTGELPEGTNAIFTTYYQIKGDDRPGLTKGERARAKSQKQAPPGFWRMDALARMAPNSVLILDESHLASGKSTTAYRFASLLRATRLAYYSSATFAKRPESVGIYFKTRLGQMSGGNLNELIKIMEDGGVPAMQVASSMLAQDGQYLRRESDFSGCKFDTTINFANEARDKTLADTYTTGLREIVFVQSRMAAAAKAINDILASQARTYRVPAAGAPRLESSNFSAKMHNLISQYLLAIKVEGVVAKAIDAIQNGHVNAKGVRTNRKVIVAVQSTMESVIEDLAGSRFPTTFQGALLNYLDGQRVFRTGRGANDSFYVSDDPDPELADLNDEQLRARAIVVGTNPLGERVATIVEPVVKEMLRRVMIEIFHEAEANIKTLDLGNMPLSPIDALRQGVERAGIQTGEITGRKVGLTSAGETYERTAKERKGRLAVMAAFNEGDVDFLVINQSGSTGISLHDSKKWKKSVPRFMILAQPNLDINEFMQILGRPKRSGQLTKPDYVNFQTTLPAEKRPAAILGRKMAMLNANTTSNAKSDVGKDEGNDIFNQYGDEVVHTHMVRHPELVRQIALSWPKLVDGGALKPLGDFAEEDPGYFARSVTGHLAILPVEEQEAFWEHVESEYKALISYLDAIGENKLRAATMDIRAKTINRQMLGSGAETGDSVFSQPAYVETVEAKLGKEPIRADEAMQMSRDLSPTSQPRQQAFIAQSDEFIAREEERKARVTLKGWDEKRDSWLSGQREQRDRIASVIGQIGQIGTYEREDGKLGYAVITDVKLDDEKPTTPSKQIVVVHVNDSRHTMRIYLSQFAEFFTPVTYGERAGWERTWDFSNIRHIITGNLLKGLKDYPGRGRIISYTTDAGEGRMGILMPTGFTNDQQAAEQNRVPVTSADQLREVLHGRQPVFNPELTVRFRESTEGVITLEVPAARSTGGKYWRDPELNRLMERGEFVESGGWMRGTIPPRNLPHVFERLVGMGETFKANPPRQSGGLSSPSAGFVTAAMDAEYFRAILRHDTETAQRMVNEAAKAAGVEGEHEAVKYGEGGKVVKLSARFNPESPNALYSAAPGDESDAGAIKAAMSELSADLPSDEDIAALKEFHDMEVPGEYTIGNPDRANLGDTDESRRLDDIGIELQQNMKESKDFTELGKVAKQRYEQDPQGVQRALLRAFKDRQPLNDLDTMAATHLYRDAARKAFNTRSASDLREAVTISVAHHMVGSEQGRALAARHDSGMTKQERFNQYLAEAILEPRTVQAKIDLEMAPRAADRDRTISRLTREIEAAKAAPSKDMEALKAKIKELLAVKRRETQEDMAFRIAQQQRDEITKALRKEGLTIEDLLGNRIEYRLKFGKFVVEAMGKDDPQREKAVDLLVHGWPTRDIAKATKMTEESITSLREELRSKPPWLREALAKAIMRGMDVSKIVPNLLSSPAANTMTLAEALAKADAVLDGLGILSEDEAKTRRMRKVRRVRPEDQSADAALMRATLALQNSKPKKGITPGSIQDLMRIHRGRKPVKDFVKKAIALGADPEVAQEAAEEFEKERARKYAPKKTIDLDVEYVPFDVNDRFQVARIADVVSGPEGNFFQKLQSLWYANVLSGPQTQSVNILDSLFVNAYDTPALLMETRKMNAELKKVTGAKQDMLALHQALRTGVMKGIEMAIRSWSSDVDVFESTYLDQDVDLDEALAAAEKYGNRSKLPSSFLWMGSRHETADDLFTKILRPIVVGSGAIMRHIPGTKDIGKAIGDNVRLYNKGGVHVGKTLRIGIRLLRMADTIMKNVRAHIEVGVAAYRIAKAQGLSGVALRDFVRAQANTYGSLAWKEAVEQAKMGALQDNNAATDIFNIAFMAPETRRALERAAIKAAKERNFTEAQRISRRLTRAAVKDYLLHFIIAFPRVAANSLRFAMKSIPLYLPVMGATLGMAAYRKRQNTKAIKAGDPSANSSQTVIGNYGKAAFVRDVARQMLGLSALGLVYLFGEGDDDDDKKRVLFVGTRPTPRGDTSARDAVVEKHGGVQMLIIRDEHGNVVRRINYGRMSSLAYGIGTLVDMMRVIKQRDHAEEKSSVLGDTYGAMVASLAQSTEEQPMMRGISNILRAMETAKTDTWEDAGDTSQGVAVKMANDIVTGFMPNMFRSIARSIDTAERDYKTADTLGFLNLHQLLPTGDFAGPRTDSYGREVEKDGSTLRRILWPSVTKVQETMPAARVLEAWNKKHPHHVRNEEERSRYNLPRFKSDDYTLKDQTGKDIKMTPEQRHEFEVKTGQSFRQRLASSLQVPQPVTPSNVTFRMMKTIKESRADAKKATKAAMSQTYYPRSSSAAVPTRSPLRETLARLRANQ